MKVSRRRFNILLCGAAFTTTVTSLIAEAADQNVTPPDSQAKSLGSHEDAATVDVKAFPTWKPGQHCSDCQFYKDVGNSHGKCAIFTDRIVPAGGWCEGYAPKS